MLYDMSSSYFEGHRCPLANRGYSRDHRRDLPQINYGLTCNRRGVPVSIDVFAENTSDHLAFDTAIDNARNKFGIEEVVFVGDRGMISSKAIDEHLRDVRGARWITALPNATLRRIMNQEPIQMTLFDDECLVEIPYPDYPEERLVLCKNPLLTDERTRKRQELLVATELHLKRIQERTKKPRTNLKGKDKIGLAIGKVIAKHRMQKHFIIDIHDDGFTFSRDETKIRKEAVLDGLYAVRTNVSAEEIPDREVVWNYKLLSRVERAFRSMKADHRTEERVKSHMFICMLSYYVEWHMREKLIPILFQDQASQCPKIGSVVTPVARSEKSAERHQKR